MSEAELKNNADFMDPNTWGQPEETIRVYLSNSDDTLFATIDAVDWPWVRENLWTFSGHGDHRSKTENYARRIGPRPRRTPIYLHKEVLRRTCEMPSEAHMLGDHIDGNSLNDRRSNLRWATLSENCANRYGFYAKQNNIWKPGE